MLNTVICCQEVQFYSDIIGVFLRWMYEAITESKFGLVWKVLVAYQKVRIFTVHVTDKALTQPEPISAKYMEFCEVWLFSYFLISLIVLI